MMRPTPNLPTPPLPTRILFIVFGCVFAGIGIAVLTYMWTASGWGAPPMIFRVVASLIAIAFVTVGGSMAWSFVRPRSMLPTEAQTTAARGTVASAGYTCPHCGATLGKEAEVSPLGDAKCTFCGRWFNIHKVA
jgi:hypothetical protein